MRMYNPEWEAIRSMEQASTVCDLVYDLQGFEIPADHGVALYNAIVSQVPELAKIAISVHPVHGAPSGRNDNLVINRRVKLVLRVPRADVDLAKSLQGKAIDPGAGSLTIGGLKEKPLTPFGTLYSHFVTFNTPDEAEFVRSAKDELEEMGVSAGLICGKQRKMLTPNGTVEGYSLMLHDVKLDQSILVQEQGLGRYHEYGCGLFIPHKSIKEVVVD